MTSLLQASSPSHDSPSCAPVPLPEFLSALLLRIEEEQSRWSGLLQPETRTCLEKAMEELRVALQEQQEEDSCRLAQARLGEAYATAVAEMIQRSLAR